MMQKTGIPLVLGLGEIGLGYKIIGPSDDLADHEEEFFNIFTNELGGWKEIQTKTTTVKPIAPLDLEEEDSSDPSLLIAEYIFFGIVIAVVFLVIVCCLWYVLWKLFWKKTKNDNDLEKGNSSDLKESKEETSKCEDTSDSLKSSETESSASETGEMEQKEADLQDYNQSQVSDDANLSQPSDVSETESSASETGKMEHEEADLQDSNQSQVSDDANLSQPSDDSGVGSDDAEKDDTGEIRDVKQEIELHCTSNRGDEGIGTAKKKIRRVIYLDYLCIETEKEPVDLINHTSEQVDQKPSDPLVPTDIEKETKSNQEADVVHHHPSSTSTETEKLPEPSSSTQKGDFISEDNKKVDIIQVPSQTSDSKDVNNVNSASREQVQLISESRQQVLKNDLSDDAIELEELLSERKEQVLNVGNIETVHNIQDIMATLEDLDQNMFGNDEEFKIQLKEELVSKLSKSARKSMRQKVAKNLQCQNCPKMFPDHTAINAHLARKHMNKTLGLSQNINSNEASLSTSDSTKIWEETNSKSQNLSRGKSTRHSRNKSAKNITCSYCGKSCTSKQNYQQHIRETHNIIYDYNPKSN